MSFSSIPKNAQFSLIKTQLQLSDYIPFLSTYTNIQQIFHKYVIMPQMSSQDVNNSSKYCQYLKQKNIVRHAIALVPIIGNIILIAAGCFNKYFANNSTKNELTQKALQRHDQETSTRASSSQDNQEEDSDSIHDSDIKSDSDFDDKSNSDYSFSSKDKDLTDNSSSIHPSSSIDTAAAPKAAEISIPVEVVNKPETAPAQSTYTIQQKNDSTFMEQILISYANKRQLKDFILLIGEDLINNQTFMLKVLDQCFSGELVLALATRYMTQEKYIKWNFFLQVDPENMSFLQAVVKKLPQDNDAIISEFTELFPQRTDKIYNTTPQRNWDILNIAQTLDNLKFRHLIFDISDKFQDKDKSRNFSEKYRLSQC